MNQKNKIILIIIIVIIVALLATVVMYNVFLDKPKDDANNQTNQQDKENNNESKDNTGSTSDKNYKEIDVNSELANNLLNNMPKYFQKNTDRMNNEYLTFCALANLNKKNVAIGDTQPETTEYSFDKVLESVKELFGDKATITQKEEYNLPIGYNKTKNSLCILPFGMPGEEQLQVIKSLKENDEEFILEIYAINVEYILDTSSNYILLDTKATYQEYYKNNQDILSIQKTKIKEKFDGEFVDIDAISLNYAQDLPVIKYTIGKKDIRGTQYYVENIEVIY